MKTKELEKVYIGEKVFHIATNNEIEKVKNCVNQSVAIIYIENNVLNVVTKDAQYLYNYFNNKNIES